MEDKLDLEERQPDSPPPPRTRLTAREARKKYGIRVVVIAALLCWFAYDGWYNPKFLKPEKKFDMWFNRVGAYILGAALVYHATMFGSAALTVRREETEGTAETDAPPDNTP